jgi:hypothetical protein
MFEVFFEIMFEVLLHTIPEIWKASRLFRIAIGIIVLVGVLMIARIIPIKF